MLEEVFRSTLVIVLGALLITAAITDLQSRTISNRLNLAICCLAPLWWMSCGLSLWPGIAAQLATAIAVFLVFAGIFALGLMGGGDVKLFSALALWFPWQVVLTLLVLTAIVGGVVTIATVVHHKIKGRSGQPEIPYGIAISFSALWIVGEQYLNQFA